jgi:hypothetical protein
LERALRDNAALRENVRTAQTHIEALHLKLASDSSAAISQSDDSVDEKVV